MRIITAVAIIALLVPSAIGAESSPASVATTSADSIRTQLASLIQREMKRKKVAGISIALIDDQQIVWSQGFGWADVAAKVPATPNSRYRVGSISKLFTDTAAMQLVAEGKLNLDSPIQAAVPWFSINSAWPNAGPMTLRHLMSHHSGMPRDVEGGMWTIKAPSTATDFRAMLRSLVETEVDAPPGLMNSYSNVGLDLVGAAVEGASGQQFEDRLQKSVLEPLAMTGASFSAAVPLDTAMARAHLKGKAKSEPALRDVPAGGLNASVTDLAKFLEMQFAAGRTVNGVMVLPLAQQQAMLQRQFPDNVLDADIRIGLGWMLSSFGGGGVKGGGLMAMHGGATPFFRSQLAMLPEQKLGVVVLSNDGAATEIVNSIAQHGLALLLEARRGIKQPPIVPGFVPAKSPWTIVQREAARSACVGDYVSMLGSAAIVPKGESLRAQVFGRQLGVREGQDGRFGLSFKLGGLVSVNLGPLSQMGFECTTMAGRNVLVATLDSERIMAGERLPAPVLPKYADRWVGNYRWLRNPDDFQMRDAGGQISVLKADGRLWIEYRMAGAFGTTNARLALQPISEKTARIVGPLADTGPVIQIVGQYGETPRVRYSGMTFERIPD
jgi:CubicO group peptidase (beta-lactamase class C family)